MALCRCERSAGQQLSPTRSSVCGLGGGLLPHVLSSWGIQVLALERSGEVLDLARRFFGLAPAVTPLEIQKISVEDFEPRHSAFDACVLDIFEGHTEAVPAFTRSKDFLSSLKRALRPGGRVLQNAIDAVEGPWRLSTRPQPSRSRHGEAVRCTARVRHGAPAGPLRPVTYQRRNEDLQLLKEAYREARSVPFLRPLKHQRQVDALAAEIRQLKATEWAVVAKVQELQRLKSQLSSDDPRTDAAFFARQKQEAEDAQKQKQADLTHQRAELKVLIRDAWQSGDLLRLALGTGPTFHYEPLSCELTRRSVSRTGSRRVETEDPSEEVWFKPPPRLNSKDCGFGAGEEPNPPVYITEKWDGTTMQATAQHIFKRIDLWGCANWRRAPRAPRAPRTCADGDGAWRGLDFLEADQRLLEVGRLRVWVRVDSDSSLIAEHPVASVDWFRGFLRSMSGLVHGADPTDAVHTDINANFKHLPGSFVQGKPLAGIKTWYFLLSVVFDFSRSGSHGVGRFLPFDETIELAKRFDLNVVIDQWLCEAQEANIWEYADIGILLSNVLLSIGRSSLRRTSGRVLKGADMCVRRFLLRMSYYAVELWADLEKASKRHYATAPAMLEGFVVREAGAGGRIAKARVEQLEAAAAVTAAAVQADPKPKMRSKTKAEAKARCWKKWCCCLLKLL
ncbi:unnamed protein product [Durusdinium trenchii]|uniref:Methyltransferase type 11 domain-containing protein n=1 Tax=Durusdinium trenchii TaxID=1381693 RepID=A0ABP0M3N0_9DINO